MSSVAPPQKGSKVSQTPNNNKSGTFCSEVINNKNSDCLIKSNATKNVHDVDDAISCDAAFLPNTKRLKLVEDGNIDSIQDNEIEDYTCDIEFEDDDITLEFNIDEDYESSSFNNGSDNVESMENDDVVVDSSPFDSLPNDLTATIFTFIGNCNARYVAAVNRLWYKLYKLVYPEMITYYNVSSIPCVTLCYNEIPSSKHMHLCYIAARENKLDIIDHLHSKLHCPWDEWVCFAAAKNGNLEILQYAIQQGAPCDYKTYYIAAKCGYHTVLQYVYEQKCDPNWYPRTICDIAAIHGHLNIIQWVQRTIEKENSGKVCVAKWSNDGMCTLAAEQGHRAIVKYGVDHGCTITDRTFALAAKNGHLYIIKYLYTKHKTCWNSQTCAHAAMNGHLHVIQWVRHKGCPWNELTIANAAKHGHLHVIHWALENNCDVDDQACAMAALNGHLNIVIYLRSRDCPWNADTTYNAAKNGHIDLLQWAMDHGCPVDIRVPNLFHVPQQDPVANINEVDEPPTRPFVETVRIDTDNE